MNEVAIPGSVGALPIANERRGLRRDGAAENPGRRQSEPGSRLAAPKRNAVAAALAGAIWVAPSMAFAYHDTTGPYGGGFALGGVVLIAAAVALGLIGLKIWDRKRPNTKFKGRKPTRIGRLKARKRK